MLAVRKDHAWSVILGGRKNAKELTSDSQVGRIELHPTLEVPLWLVMFVNYAPDVVDSSARCVPVWAIAWERTPPRC
jgi:hypothetical protein